MTEAVHISNAVLVWRIYGLMMEECAFCEIVGDLKLPDLASLIYFIKHATCA